MEARELTPAEVVPASRKLGRSDATKLAHEASKIIIAKGKKISEFKAGKDVSDDAIDAMLGPTGNLRAPTMKVGNTLLVGFNEEPFTQIFDS